MTLIFVFVALWLIIVLGVISMFRIAALGDGRPPANREVRGQSGDAPDAPLPPLVVRRLRVVP